MATNQESSVQVSPTPDRQRGCMLCRLEVVVEHFSELRPGDQISLPGRVPILGLLYDHHAVVCAVDDVSEDGHQAKLTVFDVDDKGKAGSLCPCNRETYPIKLHELYNEDSHRLTTRCLRLSGPDSILIKKIVYRQRKFDQEKTVQRANLCVANKGKDDIKYCFCLQNCEHFASACVNGPDDVVNQSLKESLSVQTLDFAWFVISALFWALQATFYGFNFWMYAVFVRRDPDFRFLSNHNKLKQWLNQTCYHGEAGTRYFETTCDWKMIGVFVGIFSALFLLIVLCYYLPLYRKRYICRQCLVTVAINLFFSRLVSFIIVEVINITAESPLYLLVTRWRLSRFLTVLVLMLVSGAGAILVYTMASVFTKVIVLCCGRCSACMEGYHHFVPLKGFMWCVCKLRCCYRDAKRKYVVEEIEIY